MSRPVSVQAEFTFSLEAAPGKPCADLECIATATVLPGEPCRPWADDPGSGPEILSDFTDIMVDCGGYDREAGRHVSEWIEPDADMVKRIKAWLHAGNANEAFEEAAQEYSGPDPDLLREMRADRPALAQRQE